MFQGYDDTIDKEDLTNGISIVLSHNVPEKRNIVCIDCNTIIPAPCTPSAFRCPYCKNPYIFDGKEIHETKDIIIRRVSPILFYKPGIFLPAIRSL